jgi:hypothetical protein
MSPFSWMFMVPVRAPKAKKNLQPDIRCPQCNERYRIVRYGRYWRYRYESHERMAVTRYACRNPDCPRRTFSVLPHPYLPLVRMPLCLLLAVYRQHVAEQQAINHLARKLRHGWNTVRRAVCLAGRILQWCGRELCAQAMPLWPCHKDRWPAFSRAYSYAFLPGLFLARPINTIR